MARSRPGGPCPKLSQSPKPADPDPIYWQKVQFQGRPLLGPGTALVGCSALQPRSSALGFSQAPTAKLRRLQAPLSILNLQPQQCVLSLSFPCLPINQRSPGAPQCPAKPWGGPRAGLRPPPSRGALCGPCWDRRLLSTVAGEGWVRLLSPPACLPSYPLGESVLTPRGRSSALHPHTLQLPFPSRPSPDPPSPPVAAAPASPCTSSSPPLPLSPSTVCTSLWSVSEKQEVTAKHSLILTPFSPPC